MKRCFFALLVCGSVALTFGARSAHAQGSDPGVASEDGNLWFVELANPPTADGTSLTTVRNEKAAFRRAAAAAGISYTERRSFDVLFNGFSVRVGPADRLLIARLDGVAAMYPVGVVAIPPRQSGSGTDLATAIARPARTSRRASSA